MNSASRGGRSAATARPASLPALLREQAEARPTAVAVECDDRSLSYRGLLRSAEQLAARLRHPGPGTEEYVGVYAEPSVELMTGAWGVLFAGAAYLPLSPEYPEDRLRYMLEDSRTRVVVTQDHLAARLAGIVPPGTRIVTLGDSGPAVGERDPGAAPADPPPEDLAYVIYTSGSTGRPKGVMIEHRAVASQLRWLQSAGHLGRDTVVLQKTPMSFDAAQWEILAPATGAKVVMGAPGSYRDPEALVETVVKHEVTTLQCVPTLLQALLDTEGFTLCTSLRRVFAGGETLSRHLARSFTEELPWASLVNLYGPTECTINATSHPVDPERIGEGAGSVPIGTPVDGTWCFVLDEELVPVEGGGTGELYIGGVQLARGYLHRPELTEERFLPSPFAPGERLYRTGDLAHRNEDGTIQFAGRVDNQVKLRGYRVELDEIALAVEEHTWVRRAAAVVTDNPRTGFQNLVACIELDPQEAALMDQGNHGGHHQSKAGKLQVKTQLSDPGLREPAELRGRPVVELPGKAGTPRQRRAAFARKTYRFYEGGGVTRADLVQLLAPRSAPTGPRTPAPLTVGRLGEILRWFGPFRSEERLLPKYVYASPGALYATQLYVETGGLPGLDAGVYYHHPVDHTLVRTGEAAAGPGPYLTLHFLGRKRAIEPVYKNNIQEVLEFETGHMVGVLEEVLPEFGLDVRPLEHEESAKERLDVAAEDHYVGAFAVVPDDGRPRQDATEVYVQSAPGKVAGLPAGQYRWADGELELISHELIQRKHVIAINQEVYGRAAFGITAVSRADQGRLAYVNLGTKLHHLQRNGLRLGFMSAGYSSRTGHPLPAARRIDDILAACGIGSGAASYFFLGGRVSEEQIAGEGMYEDTVHMQGPAEMIKDELAAILPDYMIPNRVLVLDELPLTVNGKVDVKALAASEAVRSADTGAPHVAPSTPTERRLAAEWAAALKYDYENVSVTDEFFASGGNSLTAVALVNRINRQFGTRLPFQALFEHPKLADLAARIANGVDAPSSRLVPLGGKGTGRPVFCWPGLGGYPMNLRLLAQRSGLGRPFHGIQAHGINDQETPYATIRETAAADIAEIRRAQPEGPYTLWGYSFGARVAFEAAWQLESAGQQVADLLLICPGNPKVRAAGGAGREASFGDQGFVTILFSVFAGTVSGPELDRCLGEVRDEEGFVSFVHELFSSLDRQLIRRITRIVEETYEFEYTFRELAERRLRAPVAIFKARGDDYSFIEGSSGYSAEPPTVLQLEGDHYAVLKEHGVGELASAIRAHLGA